ncbi:MAG TPA: redox-regulated ATPase YchF [Chlamydiales bacterium]|nr:redox-regulated ATPase YchF [Chlamydiales bacterium]
MSSLSCGIVGLPNVGKSTLFTALTRKQIPAENYPFCTIDPNVGIVELNDSRLQELQKMSSSQKIIYATVSFTDIAGLVKGASKGEGLGNKFLSNIRQTDAILHVVRCFENDDVIHVEGKIDPIDDIETINLELILADLEVVEKNIQKMEKQAKGNKAFLPTLEFLQKARAHLEDEKPLRTLELTKEELSFYKIYSFITNKKVLYIANISEEDLQTGDNEFVQRVKAFAEKEDAAVLPICAKLEEEMAQLSPEEAKEFLKEVGLKETGLDKLIRKAFELLGLITYITTGEIETRAWTIKKGTKAPQAAGKIHSDIEKGFIRAEVISYNDMMHYKGRVGAKEAGKARMEGKEYEVQDGDVILFHHS